jgi:hypothetical protein
MRQIEVFTGEGIPGGYRWRLKVCGGEEYGAVSDRLLGSMMGAIRGLVASVAVEVGHVVPPDPKELCGPIRIEEMRVEATRTSIWPGWRVWMKSGEYEYTAFLDHGVDSLVYAMMGAMKFFAAKYGIVYLYEDAARNVDRAHEQGFEA